MAEDIHKQTTCTNPATMEIIGSYPENSVQDVLQSVVEARKAQKAWAQLTFAERAEYLYRMRDYITQNADSLARTIAQCTGKTRIDAMSTEVLPTAMAVNYYAKNAKQILQRRRVHPGNILTANKWSYIDRIPMGVIGIISPWNYPFGIPMHEVAMALIAGNSVILKVASQTLPAGYAIEECAKASGLPPGIFTHLNLPGRLAGDSFIESGINKLFFTGSVTVGKYLMKKAADRLLPLSLELGGNDAMIVCKDANIERAVGGALWAGLSNSGQSCAGVERIYIDKAIYPEFTTLLKHRLNGLRQGYDTNFDVEIGSLTTPEQLKTVQNHVKDAMDKGARIFAGQHHSGENNIGLFHTPVILEDVTPDMLTMQDETFGPVLAVDSFSTVAEAISKANSCNLGLTASVWSSDSEAAHKIASQLEAGAITINDHLMSHGLAETPWGGFKESGLERTHGHAGLEGMTQSRVVIDDILPMLQKNMWWYPHSKEVYDGLKGALHALYAKDIGTRLEGLSKTTKLFVKCFMRKK